MIQHVWAIQYGPFSLSGSLSDVTGPTSSSILHGFLLRNNEVKQFNLNYKLTNLECRSLLLPHSRQLVANNSSLVYLWLLDLKALEILATLLVFILKCKKNNVINSFWLSTCLFLVPKGWQFESNTFPAGGNKTIYDRSFTKKDQWFQ